MPELKEITAILRQERTIKILNKEFSYDFVSLLIFAFIFTYLLIIIILPFVLYNNLVNWDLPGQMFSSWYQKEYLFPHITGWNPFYFAGYPQNQFYPPLWSCVTALISFIIPLVAAFKLMFSLSLILLPISFYFFARKFHLSRISSSITMLGMFSILFLFPNKYYGGNFASTFHAGLIVHMLALALFFFYLGTLNKSIETKRFVATSILLALIILTHIIVGIFSIIILAGFLIYNLKNKEKFLTLIKISILSFLLSSFWTIPFIGKIAFLSSSPIIAVSKTFIIVSSIIVLLSLILNKNKEYSPIIISLAILSILMILSIYILKIPIHNYRFIMFFYLLIPITLFKIIPQKFWQILAIIILISSLLIIFSNKINPIGEENINIQKLNYTISPTERILITPSLEKSIAPHVLQHYLVMNNDIKSLKGLFIESSKNGRFIFDLDEELIPRESSFWGAPVDWNIIPRNKSFIIDILPAQFNLFAINWIVGPINPTNSSQKIIDFQNNAYYLYHLSNFSLVEILNSKPTQITSDNWDDKVATWFLSKEVKETILVDEKVPEYLGKPNDSIEILNISKRQDYLKLQVNSSDKVPILVKISYFPNWKAYENGKEIKIYKASPYLMLVYGTGIIELKYKSTFWDILGNLLTILGLISLFYFTYKTKKEN